jgi:hypothetical protein
MILYVSGTAMNKHKNWYHCYSIPARIVQENSTPRYILYPFSRRRVNCGCPALRQSWRFRLGVNWNSDNRCVLSRQVNTASKVTKDTSPLYLVMEGLEAVLLSEARCAWGMAAVPLVTSDERRPTRARHRSDVPACIACVFHMQTVTSWNAELSQLWRRVCVRVSSSISLPFLISLFFLLFVFPSVALSSISLVMCWNRETFSGSVWTVSLLSRIAACIYFNDRQYTVLE